MCLTFSKFINPSIKERWCIIVRDYPPNLFHEWLKIDVVIRKMVVKIRVQFDLIYVILYACVRDILYSLQILQTTYLIKNQ